MQSYPWYEIVKESPILMQGDIVLNCPIIIPPDSPSLSPRSDSRGLQPRFSTSEFAIRYQLAIHITYCI